MKTPLSFYYKHKLCFSSQLLMGLIYDHSSISHEGLGLLFAVSDRTRIPVVDRMTKLLAAHFRMPGRRVHLTNEEKDNLIQDNPIQAKLRIGVEHAIGRMKKFRIFSDIDANNALQDMMAKNVAALANTNVKSA